jgi:hypothetical protein
MALPVSGVWRKTDVIIFYRSLLRGRLNQANAQAARQHKRVGLLLRDLQLAAFDAVDQTMLAGNAPRPPAGEITFKALGLAEPGEGVALEHAIERARKGASLYPLEASLFGL